MPLLTVLTTISLTRGRNGLSSVQIPWSMIATGRLTRERIPPPLPAGPTQPTWNQIFYQLNQSASPDPAPVLMPAVHRIAGLLKRWLLGTYQGGVSRKHLNYYLDEYTFRFNRRSSRSRGLLFYRLLEQAVQTQHTPTHALFMATGRGPH